MDTSPSVNRRLCGLLLALAGVVSLLNAPLATFASTRAYVSSEPGGEPPPIPGGLEPLFAFAKPAVVYATYGKVWVPVLLLTLPALHVLPTGRLWPCRLLLAGLALLVVGNVGDYWLGKRLLGQALWGASFMLTGLGSLAYMIGAVVIGIHAWKRFTLPRPVAAPLAVAPLALPANLLLPNWPAAFFFVAAFGWIAFGGFLLRGRQ